MIEKRIKMAKLKMEKLQANRMAKRALGLVSDLIEKHGPRLSGSEACLETAEELASELRPLCDRTEVETFSLHPNAFLGWIKLMVIVYPVALLAFWFSITPLAILLAVGAILIMVFQFFLYKELIDPLYPKAEGRNVYGVIEPEGEVKQTVVYSGHHDSARVFNFFMDKPHLYMVRVGIGIGAYIALALLSVAALIVQIIRGKFFLFTFTSPFFLVWAIILTIALPWVFKLWQFASDEGTPGAGDNLIASAMGVELAAYFNQRREEGTPLKNTRLVLASFDGEEAGLRGARAFFQRHQYDSEVLSSESWNFNVDCPYNAKDLFFLTSDINGSVQLSQEMASQCVALAKEMGFEAFSQPIAFLTGGTDAAEAAKVGVKATTLMAMPWGNSERAAAYHTPNDVVEAIEPLAVEVALSIAIKFIENLDSRE